MQIVDCRKDVRGLSLLTSDDSLAFFFLTPAFHFSVSVHLIKKVGERSRTVFPLCSLLPAFFLLALHLSSCLFDLLPARRRDNILDEPSADKLMPAAAL